jgi:hypothetical protein
MAIAKDGEAAREILMQIAEQNPAQMKLRKPPAKVLSRPLFSLEKNKGWRRVAA